MSKDIIIKGIKDNHLFCCGIDLGELKKEKAYFCEKCERLYFHSSQKQKKVLDFI